MPPNAGAGVRHARQKLFRTYWQMSGKKSPGSGAGVGANTELDPWTFATLYKTTWISRWGFFLADDDASKYLCSVISKGLPRRPSGGRRRWDGRRNFLFKIPGKPLALPAEFLTENPRQNAGKKSLGLGAGAGANPDYFRNAIYIQIEWSRARPRFAARAWEYVPWHGECWKEKQGGMRN